VSYTTRFAPSPTGPLHLGHAFSALTAFDRARDRDGQFLLRIEDIDRQRSKPEWEAQIYDDLHWLGLTWPEKVLRQSERLQVYREALADLWGRDLLFVCTCNRRDILAAVSAPQEGAPMGPDGVIYPGTCRHRTRSSGAEIPSGAALRLHMERAMETLADDTFEFEETGGVAARGRVIFTPGEAVSTLGDIVLSRRDFPGSYHLSVVLDDAGQSVTEVVRGADLFDATKIHVILQRLLELPRPSYHHHRLIRDAAGKRLAKRDDARSIAAFRADGASPADIRSMVGLTTG
jgi:glutamyl-Q tRNA(Asp) synthetase